MSTKRWNDIPSVLARILLAFIFLFGQTVRATQSQNGKDRPDSKPAAKSQQAPTKPSTAPEERIASAKDETVAEEHSQRSGQHEGIKVHGHWTIEVRNPDGTLVTHREFENSLASAGGAYFLTQILTRQSTVGVWTVFLTARTTTSGVPINTALIDEAGGSFAVATHAASCGLFPDTDSCSTNLTLSQNPTGTGFTLNGSAVIPPSFGTAINLVETDNYPCGPGQPQSCQSDAVGANRFTSRLLDGLNGDPAPLLVSPGQTVAVTVNISFS